LIDGVLSKITGVVSRISTGITDAVIITLLGRKCCLNVVRSAFTETQTSDYYAHTSEVRFLRETQVSVPVETFSLIVLQTFLQNRKS
jgi:hypothetical protein